MNDFLRRDQTKDPKNDVWGLSLSFKHRWQLLNSSNYAIQIIPDLTIDEKYAAIIEQALNRINAFTAKALQDDRIKELYLLEKSNFKVDVARRILEAAADWSSDFSSRYVQKRLTTISAFTSRRSWMKEEFQVLSYSYRSGDHAAIDKPGRSAHRSDLLHAQQLDGHWLPHIDHVCTAISSAAKTRAAGTSCEREGITRKLDKLAVAKASERRGIVAGGQTGCPGIRATPGHEARVAGQFAHGAGG